jgi:hypothetical protein
MKRLVLTLFAFAAIAAEASAFAEAGKPAQWITREEAGLPPMAVRETKTGAGEHTGAYAPAERKENAGPVIQVEKPREDTYYNDLIDILVRFERNPLGKAVNMESLRVVYLKMFGIDITDRIRPFVRENQIDATRVKFPQGEHQFEIRIKDQEQMESSKVVSIRVQ